MTFEVNEHTSAPRFNIYQDISSSWLYLTFGRRSSFCGRHLIIQQTIFYSLHNNVMFVNLLTLSHVYSLTSSCCCESLWDASKLIRKVLPSDCRSMKPLTLSYVFLSPQSIVYCYISFPFPIRLMEGVLFRSYGKGKAWAVKGTFFIRLVPKIISSEIICTNKNYVESSGKRRERRKKKSSKRRHRKFTCGMVFAWVRLTKFHQYGSV